MQSIDHNLLKEFSDPPAGEYIRYDFIFDNLKEQRHKIVERLKDPGLSKELKSTCQDFCTEVSRLLNSKTKDFVLVFWLIEATTITQSYKGLEDSSVFLRDFLELFWYTAHPIEDGHELKASAIQWFDKEFSNNLKFIPLFGNNQDQAQNFSKERIDALNKQQRFWVNRPNRTMTRDQKQKHSEFRSSWDTYQAFCSALSVSSLRENILCLNTAIRNFELIEKLIEGFIPCTPSALERTQGTLLAMRGSLEQTVKLLDIPAKLDISELSDRTDERHFQKIVAPDLSTSNEPKMLNQAELVEHIKGLADKKDIYEILSLLVDKLTELDPNSPNVQLGKKMLIIKDMSYLDILEELVDDERARNQVIKFFGLS